MLDAYSTRTRFVSLWLQIGLLLLARNSLDDAHRHFKQVLGENPRSIPALLGMARIHFVRENYSQALSLYRNVLKMLPECNPNPRLGLGLCFYKLGMLEQAQLAFERCIEVASITRQI